MSIHTFDLALRAETHKGDCFESGLFGKFNTTGIDGDEVTLAFFAERYAYIGSPLCLRLWTQDENPIAIWEPYVDLTKNYRPNDCKRDEIVVKTYEEYEHLRCPLLKLGYFEDTGKRISSEFVELEIWRLTDKFVEAFSVAHPELVAA